MNNNIFPRVQSIVCDCLAVEPHEVKEETNFVMDLGAESIDLLDLAFRIEKTFEVTAGREAFFPSRILLDERYVKDGLVTADGFAELERAMPYADFTRFREHGKIQDFPVVLTVGAVCKYVEGKIEEGQAK